MSGFYLMHRGFWDDDIFSEQPFTEREAWHWLISQAAFDDHKTRHPIKYQMVSVARGQLPTTVRELSRRWKWSVGKVQRFLKLLAEDGKIGTTYDTHLTIITILNYNKYQGEQKICETKNGTTSEQPRNNPETETEQQDINKGKTREETKDIIIPPTPLKPPDGFLEFYEKFPIKKKRPEALSAYTKAIKKGADHETIIRGLERHLAAWATWRPEERRFIGAPAPWLNGECWNDDPEFRHNAKGSATDGLTDYERAIVHGIERIGSNS